MSQLREEIKETEAKIKTMRQTLEDCYRKQRDLANERAKLKQRFQTADLSLQSLEMLRLILRQHILTQQTLDYEHKSSQQEVQLKIKEAQTQSLSEQLKLRDEVIMRTKFMLKDQVSGHLSPGSRGGSISSRQNGLENQPGLPSGSGANSRSQNVQTLGSHQRGQSSVSNRDIHNALTDDRIIPLDEIIK